MGRKKCEPTRVVGVRITAKDYARIQQIAKETKKSVAAVYQDFIKRGYI